MVRTSPRGIYWRANGFGWAVGFFVKTRKPPSAPHKIVYWDACIWIAWLKEEERPYGDMEGTQVSVDHIYAGRSDLILSRLIVDQELKVGRLPPKQQDLFYSFRRRSNVILIDFEPPILALMVQIFDHYSANPVGGKTMDMQDALHLATAINRNANAFYSFDTGKRSGLNLLRISGDEAIHGLTVCKPPFEQAPILFRSSPPLQKDL